ncbi:MAG: type II toxin-antitoxin system VapC family toxin, partial [Rhodocyclaceae bacterium]|nr:type II toxin-antitoxin system VapC family toxin [Rhodocyclaceae bacterium]
MIWVIDTSALVRLFVPDGPVHAETEQAFRRVAAGDGAILAPQLLLAESANVLLRKQRRGELSSEELHELMSAVAALPIRYCEHETLLHPAIELALAHGLSAYDALFLALAERHAAKPV